MEFYSLRDSNGADGGEHPEHVSYQKTWDLQKRLVEVVSKGECPNTILFVEHESVITRGRGLQFTGQSPLLTNEPRERHRPAPLFLPGEKEIPVLDIDRGGDLTWHGPGQFVCYPILRLDGKEAPEKDVEAALRGFESAVIEALKAYSIPAFTKKNETGVWVSPNSGSRDAPTKNAGDAGRGADKKIASLGIGVRKWTTFHGLALNVVNDLRFFSSFSPCGFSSEVMTSVKECRPENITSHWRRDLEALFAEAFLLKFPNNLSTDASGELNRNSKHPFVLDQEIDAFFT